MVIKPNGNVDSQFLEVVEGGVYANLKSSLKDTPGDYQCKAIVTVKDETVIPDQVFTYKVNEDKFLASFNQNMVSNEDYTLLTDILGRLSTVETDEQQRQINEAERILNEESRKVAENTRVEAEINRVKVEINRVDAEALRVEAEKLRNDNYSFMTSDEERRRSEENSRIEAENLRKQAESTRVNEESQRRTTEQARVLKEKERESKETERAANEVKRVEAETARQSKFNSKILEVDNKVVEVNVAKDTVIIDTKEAINTMKEDVANAIASGTQDLEIKEARKDLKGKTHESLKLRIASDFEGLKESQDMAYSTDKGYLVCKETKNGTVKDIKISGKSLLNLCEKRKFTVVGNGSSLVGDKGMLSQSIDNGIEYTVIVKVPSDLPSNKCVFRAYDVNGTGRVNIFDGNELYNNRGRILVKKVQNSTNRDTPIENVRLFVMQDSTDTFSLDDVMVIIGDHTQSPPSYFEGIASVGNGTDKIEVSSRWGNGNLIGGEGALKSDEKTVLFRDAGETWKPVVELRGLGVVCDTVELHNDGKYYYHIRTKEVVLNGSEDWKVDNPSDKGVFSASIASHAGLAKGEIICNKLPSITASSREGVMMGVATGKVLICVEASKLLSQDIRGFKQWLASNNLTVIYQLAEEKIFEANPLFLEAFEGETMVLINSGVINAPMEFKLTSSLPNLTRNLQIRIDNLENEIYKSQELQDIMLLENDLRLMDLEFALLESTPIKLNLRSDVMFAKGVTEFEFLKGRILSGSHTDEYLEKCINKYKKAGRLTDEEYDILYDMIYPPVYDVLADK